MKECRGCGGPTTSKYDVCWECQAAGELDIVAENEGEVIDERIEAWDKMARMSDEGWYEE